MGSATVSLAGDVKALKLDKAARDVKVLTIDVERFPAKTLSYELWQVNIPKEWVLEPPRISRFSAKWLHEKKPFGADERSGHEAMVRLMWDALTEADVVVTFNGDRADFPWMNEEFERYGFGPAAPFKSVDLYKSAKARFNLMSRSLQYLGEFLERGGKLDSGGSGLVRRLVTGQGTEKDWRQYELYNDRDVTLTERAYLDLLPWLKNQPHMGMMIADGTESRCAFCGSTKLNLHHKKVHAFVRSYQLYRCAACGGWNRSTALTGHAQYTRPVK
ncbi:hypothetical protein GCM10022287_22060 [Gryllotalpicola koreensis]|uniref:YprB ribonuclease H-like domain-containing protein n=1 Tax=Gryllotalpicola koreensis TaxID=993086 RepID=A0ABP8A1T0_9MICO